jgi:predicted HD superfamily hydrolase involved in NAD metabolism
VEDRAKRDTPLEAADVFARERLSAKRYGHTLRVANTAEDLARAHGLDPGRARLAALLHDAARETSSEEFLDLADDLGLSVGEPERESPKLLHGPVAAELARRELGVEDEGVLEAIRDHTTGRPGMGPLSLVLYVADKIEPARTTRVSRICACWPGTTFARPPPSPCGAPSPTTRSAAAPRTLRAGRRSSG